VHFKGEYLLWFGIGLAMSFVPARYLGLEIDWNLSHRCSAWCALGRTEIRLLPHCSLHGVEEKLRAIFRVMMCARGARGFVYAYFDIYWIAVAIAAARLGWGIV
jgi:hypothetical protein